MLCILPVETIARELDGRLYLAYKLVTNGHDCVIGKKEWVHEFMLNANEPYFYLSKGLGDNIYLKIKETNGFLGVIDEEGGVHSDPDLFLCRMTDEVLEYVDLYFAWGKNIKNHILSNRDNINSDDIIISGNPRFDLCKREFLDYHRIISCGNEKIKKDYILINTNFAIVNHQLGAEARIEYIKTIEILQKYDKHVKGAYFHPDKIRKEEAIQQEVFDDFIELTKAIAKKFPERDIVVRPHPIENIQTYKDCFSSLKNVHVVRKGSAIGWIADAALLIHHDCTTGIEAMLLEKPTIAYCKKIDKQFTQWLPVKSGFQLQSIDDIINITDKYFSNEVGQDFFIEKYDYDLIKNYIANIDFSSADTIKNSINIFAKRNDVNSDRVSSSPQKIIKSTSKSTYILKLIKQVLHCFQSKNADGLSSLMNNKFNSISSKDIRLRLNSLSKILRNNPSDIKVIKVAPSTFLLKMKKS